MRKYISCGDEIVTGNTFLVSLMFLIYCIMTTHIDPSPNTCANNIRWLLGLLGYVSASEEYVVISSQLERYMDVRRDLCPLVIIEDVKCVYDNWVIYSNVFSVPHQPTYNWVVQNDNACMCVRERERKERNTFLSYTVILIYRCIMSVGQAMQVSSGYKFPYQVFYVMSIESLDLHGF